MGNPSSQTLVGGNEAPVINYRGGGRLVEKEKGSDIFVHEKRGGAKNFVQYKYLPR